MSVQAVAERLATATIARGPDGANGSYPAGGGDGG